MYFIASKTQFCIDRTVSALNFFTSITGIEELVCQYGLILNARRNPFESYLRSSESEDLFSETCIKESFPIMGGHPTLEGATILTWTGQILYVEFSTNSTSFNIEWSVKSQTPLQQKKLQLYAMETVGGSSEERAAINTLFDEGCSILEAIEIARSNVVACLRDPLVFDLAALQALKPKEARKIPFSARYSEARQTPSRGASSSGGWEPEKFDAAAARNRSVAVRANQSLNQSFRNDNQYVPRYPTSVQATGAPFTFDPLRPTR